MQNTVKESVACLKKNLKKASFLLRRRPMFFESWDHAAAKKTWFGDVIVNPYVSSVWEPIVRSVTKWTFEDFFEDWKVGEEVKMRIRAAKKVLCYEL